MGAPSQRRTPWMAQPSPSLRRAAHPSRYQLPHSGRVARHAGVQEDQAVAGRPMGHSGLGDCMGGVPVRAYFRSGRPRGRPAHGAPDCIRRPPCGDGRRIVQRRRPESQLGRGLHDCGSGASGGRHARDQQSRGFRAVRPARPQHRDTVATRSRLSRRADLRVKGWPSASWQRGLPQVFKGLLHLSFPAYSVRSMGDGVGRTTQETRRSGCRAAPRVVRNALLIDPLAPILFT